jgi:hypothetical protein
LLTSVTSLIKQYSADFDKLAVAKACHAIGLKPNHPKYELYKGKSVDDILAAWDKRTIAACDKGTLIHSKLETQLNQSFKYTQYHLIPQLQEEHLVPLHELLAMDMPSNVSLDRLADQFGISFPEVYEYLVSISDKGYTYFTECAIVDYALGLAGQIDLLCINPSTKQFEIIDWKTNQSPICEAAGYYAKNSSGELTDTFVYTNTTMKYPVGHLPDSNFYHYSLQLSMYAYLIERLGYELNQLTIFHISGCDDDITHKCLLIRPRKLLSEVDAIVRDFTANKVYNGQ